MPLKDFRKVFVTGCDTGVGKTIVSAILAEALYADYWKPIQCGLDDDSDSLDIARLVSNTKTEVFPETHLLQEPISPHAAAAYEKVEISLSDFQMPSTNKFLVIEGAGGLLVPLNKKDTIADLITYLDVPTIVVSKNYLGSINHTLLTIKELQRREIPILGVIFVGDPTPTSETAIINMGKVKMLGRVGWEDTISPIMVQQYAQIFREVL